MDSRQLANDPEEAARIAQEGHQAGIWTALPCIIKSVNFDEMTIEAQPSIQGLTQDEFGNTTYVNYPLLVDVPIVFPSGGGFVITFPLAAGDEVLVVFSSRCIDAWWQSGGIQQPAEMRMHDLSDGFAIPGPRSKPKVAASISTSALQIRNDAGTASVEIGADGKIKLTGSEIDFAGNLKVTGTISATGEVAAMTASPATTVHLSTHTHTSAAPGNPTSPPTPGS